MAKIKFEKAQIEVERDEMRIKIVENDAFEREKQFKFDAIQEKHVRGLDAQVNAGLEMKRLIRETDRMSLLQEAEMENIYNERLESERNRILNGGNINKN